MHDLHRKIRLGTRGSALARWQADWVAAQLRELGRHVEQVLISTQGDVQQGPIGALGGQGVFTKEIQRALLDEEIDLAVHSLKDLPTEVVDGLVLGAVPPRERCGDALVCGRFDGLDALPAGAVIGTGSVRRQAQLLHVRPDLKMAEIRGNLDTRLRKLDEGQYDAILLAEAGLVRLGWEQRIAQVLSPDPVLPAVGQGALGLEIRAADDDLRETLQLLNDPTAEAAVRAERALLHALRGGCLAPVGAWARLEEQQLVLEAAVLSRDGRQRLSCRRTAPADAAPHELGQQVASELLAQGAGELIQAGRT